MSLINYKEKLKALENQYAKESGQLEQLEDLKRSLSTQLANCKQQNQLLEQARMLLQKAGNDARETARKRLQETVTDALKYVFGSDFEFIIEFKETRGRTEAEFYVQSDYNGEKIKTKPEDARGGGVVDIISIALRVALIQIYNNPVIRGPIILDEPGKHVSADYTMKLATFLKQINQTFDRQIIISTHQPDLANIADDSYTVELKGGKSVVTRKV
jgi:DNA repair exonuclease SbcCD ATPase subunit